MSALYVELDRIAEKLERRQIAVTLDELQVEAPHIVPGVIRMWLSERRQPMHVIISSKGTIDMPLRAVRHLQPGQRLSVDVGDDGAITLRP